MGTHWKNTVFESVELRFFFFIVIMPGKMVKNPVAAAAMAAVRNISHHVKFDGFLLCE